MAAGYFNCWAAIFGLFSPAEGVEIREISQIQQGTFAALWSSHATQTLCSSRNRNEPRFYAFRIHISLTVQNTKPILFHHFH